HALLLHEQVPAREDEMIARVHLHSLPSFLRYSIVEGIFSPVSSTYVHKPLAPDEHRLNILDKIFAEIIKSARTRGLIQLKAAPFPSSSTSSPATSNSSPSAQAGEFTVAPPPTRLRKHEVAILPYSFFLNSCPLCDTSVFSLNCAFSNLDSHIVNCEFFSCS
ncbi:hypothetical protein PENTCL1PPCAC_606, partial [Pristionchus entomophagus]